MQPRFTYLFRPDPKPEKGGGDPVAEPQDRTSPETLDAIVCRQCLHVITSSAERTVVNGAHAHTFANPEGIVFEIACYRDAWGCAYVGPIASIHLVCRLRVAYCCMRQVPCSPWMAFLGTVMAIFFTD
jgi:hypothetical protein